MRLYSYGCINIFSLGFILQDYPNANLMLVVGALGIGCSAAIYFKGAYNYKNYLVLKGQEAESDIVQLL